MFQPSLALVLTLFLGTATAARSHPPARAPQLRGVTMPAASDDPIPEVYVAPGFLTTLVFPMPLERASVMLDEQVTHFAVVDVGERTLALEPKGEWGPEKRLELKERFKDGTKVALILATHPTQVDSRVDVERPRSVESPRAELAALQARCAEGGLLGLLLAEMLDEGGVVASNIRAPALSDNTSGLKLLEGLSHRATQWALVDLRVRNLPGQAPWVPLKARLVGPGGLTVEGVAMWTEKPRLAPGEAARILVQTDAPHWEKGTVLRLEIQDSGGGRPLYVDAVSL